jgi:hypothetical protein
MTRRTPLSLRDLLTGVVKDSKVKKQVKTVSDNLLIQPLMIDFQKI